MKNSADQGDLIQDLHNSSCPSKAQFNCFIYLFIYLFIQNIFKLLKEKMSSLFFCSPKIINTTSSPGFLGQWFNILERIALLTSF